MRTADDIADLLDQRSRWGQSRQAVMNEMALLYHGRITVPLPELSKEETPAVANYVMQAIEQKAMRIASVLPVTRTFARSSQGTNGRRMARDRRIAFLNFHESNGLARQMRTRARWLSAYSTSPVLILPDYITEVTPRALGGPKWLLTDPRGFYPHIDPTNTTNPIKDDAIFHTKRSLGWLRRNFPEAAAKVSAKNSADDDRVDWIVYADHEQITTMVSRATSTDNTLDIFRGQRPPTQTRQNAVINFAENRTDHPPIVSPGGISLTMEPMGRFDQVIGMYRRMAEIDALSRIALQKSIFSEAWATSNPGERVRVVERPEPMEGGVGRVEGGRIEFRQLDPQFATRIGVGDLERAIRLTGMIPAEFGGELPTNARTARQGGRLLSNVIDFDIQEAQELLAESIMHENRIAAMTDKEFFGGFSKTIEVANGATEHHLSYDPAKLWSTVNNTVSYALAGTDSDGSVIGAGQRMGMGTLSRESFMEVDPMVKDVEVERDRVSSEAIRDAFLSKIQQEAAAPPGQTMWTSQDFARYAELVESDTYDIIEGYGIVNEEAKERQATPVEAGTPAAQPGVAGEVPPTVAGPSESGQNLTQLLGQLRLAGQTVPGEIPA